MSNEPKAINETANFVERFNRLLTGDTASLDTWWKELEQVGSPIFVDRGGNDGFYYFIFRGDETTRSVFLDLPPFSRIAPEKFRLSQVGATDLWYVGVELPAAARFSYSFLLDLDHATREKNTIAEKMRPDQFNSDRVGSKRSIVTTPGAEVYQFPFDAQTAADLPNVQTETFVSEILQNERDLAIYRTPNFDQKQPTRLLICFDKDIYLNEIKAAKIIDSLFLAGNLPQVTAVFVGNPTGMRDIELAADQNFRQMIVSELMPEIKKRYPMISAGETTICGASFGGLTALYIGLAHPQIFGSIIAQSPSLWRKQIELTDVSHAQRVYIDAGLFEIEERESISLVDAARNFVVEANGRGHQIFYKEFRGGHGSANWRETFPDALEQILGTTKK